MKKTLQKYCYGFMFLLLFYRSVGFAAEANYVGQWSQGLFFAEGGYSCGLRLKNDLNFEYIYGSEYQGMVVEHTISGKYALSQDTITFHIQKFKGLHEKEISKTKSPQKCSVKTSRNKYDRDVLELLKGCDLFCDGKYLRQ